MTAPFHAGDRVYVKPSAISILGYRLTEDIGAGLFAADQLDLVAAGEARRLTKAHLEGSG